MFMQGSTLASTVVALQNIQVELYTIITALASATVI